MAKRQDRDDTFPEMTESGNRGDDRVRSGAASEDDEFEDTEDLDDEVEDDTEEGDI